MVFLSSSISGKVCNRSKKFSPSFALVSTFARPKQRSRNGGYVASSLRTFTYFLTILLLRKIHKVSSYLIENEVAHNFHIMRGRRCLSLNGITHQGDDDSLSVRRVFLWPRNPVHGKQCLLIFVGFHRPKACQLIPNSACPSLCWHMHPKLKVIYSTRFLSHDTYGKHFVFLRRSLLFRHFVDYEKVQSNNTRCGDRTNNVELRCTGYYNSLFKPIPQNRCKGFELVRNWEAPHCCLRICWLFSGGK